MEQHGTNDNTMASLHAPQSANSVQSLREATRGEIEADILGDSVYAFQVFDVHVFDDFPIGCRDEECDEYPPCTVCVFGVDVDGRSVMARTQGFKPYIFVELPRCRGMTGVVMKNKFEEEIKCVMGRYCPKYDTRYVRASRLGGYVPPDDSESEGGIHKSVYAKMSFDRVSTMKYVARTLKREMKDRICEERVPIPLKFCDSVRTFSGTELEPCGWMGVTDLVLETRDKTSWCDVELVCDIQQIRSLTKVNRMAPLMVASYDIECVSPSGEFPDPEKPDNPVVVIGTTYKRVGTLPQREGGPDIGGFVRTSHVLGTCDKVDGVNVFPHATEAEMINSWSREITQGARADCIVGYNIFGFDNAYMTKRSQYHTNSELLCTSKLRDETVKPVCKTLSSSAMGDNEVHHLPMSGRFSFDMFQWIKNRFTNLKSLSLDFVSRNFLGNQADDGKIALPYSKIGVAFGPSGNASLRAEVVEYCAQDCDLPLRLAEKLSAIQEVTEMSRVCHTLINDVLTRGQQIKVYSHLLVAAHKMGFVMNDLPPAPEAEKYTGATVLDPIPGFYGDRPVVTLDFASLYPSVMRSKNLCFSSWVPPKTKLPPGVETETFELGNGRTAQFVKASTHKGVLPRVLESLLGARKMTRKKLKELPKGSDERNLLDGRQLAYKITCNSCYGFCGSNKGMYPLKAIAETTTCVGRSMIDATKSIIERKFDGQVIYGDTDSVMVIFPIDYAKGRSEVDMIQESFDLGEIAAKKVTDHFGDCNELECEKVSFPYLLFGKKTYAARVFEDMKGKPKLDVKGLAVVRRDTCDFAAKALKETLDALVMRNSVEDARLVVKDTIDRLIKNDIPIDDLLLSKRLSGSYANTNLPHLAVVRKMEERNPGSAPKSGDRVAYVLVETGDKNARVFEKAEDPTYVKNNSDVKLDRLHYLTNHLIKPVTQLFSPFDSDPSRMFTEALFALQRQQSKQTTLCSSDVDVYEAYSRKVSPPAAKSNAKKRKQASVVEGGEAVDMSLAKPSKKKTAVSKQPDDKRQLTLFESLHS